ncbi:LOW QUALITY PROTEIN: hypothetical protein PanWU01x14_157030 [Parasponia andersonii]|uniref:Uncharacterized protein n=1 Tax=Parasponia andersonii TaxID=3476 RepID=A0A2P5CFL2_PARAD|nr:LOW QUALITY PROTEIN: hypothetical protein PanWU01x14_157030 [Parasponia andersonii]
MSSMKHNPLFLPSVSSHRKRNLGIHLINWLLLKFNVDPAVCVPSMTLGIRAIIRDHLGVVMGAMATSIKGSFDPYNAALQSAYPHRAA